MERYGFFLSQSGVELDKFSYFHNTLYKNIAECIRVSRDVEGTDRKSYFKILNNTEIISLVHLNESKKKFGYISICNVCTTNNNYLVHSYSSKFYEDILDCVLDAKTHVPRNEDETDYCYNYHENKMAYFYVMNDDNLVSELHAPCTV